MARKRDVGGNGAEDPAEYPAGTYFSEDGTQMLNGEPYKEEGEAVDCGIQMPEVETVKVETEESELSRTKRADLQRRIKGG